jgi:hypothetical protein
MTTVQIPDGERLTFSPSENDIMKIMARVQRCCKETMKFSVLIFQEIGAVFCILIVSADDSINLF